MTETSELFSSFDLSLFFSHSIFDIRHCFFPGA